MPLTYLLTLSVLTHVVTELVLSASSSPTHPPSFTHSFSRSAVRSLCSVIRLLFPFSGSFVCSVQSVVRPVVRWLAGLVGIHGLSWVVGLLLASLRWLDGVLDAIGNERSSLPAPAPRLHYGCTTYCVPPNPSLSHGPRCYRTASVTATPPSLPVSESRNVLWLLLLPSRSRTVTMSSRMMHAQPQPHTEGATSHAVLFIRLLGLLVGWLVGWLVHSVC